MASSKRILVTGSVGQIGSELVPLLRKKYGNQNVIAAGNRTAPTPILMEGPFEYVNVEDKNAIVQLVQKYDVGTIYHLASLLSAVSEAKPDEAWNININGLKNVLDVARDHQIKVFWPSSIGAFGPSTPKIMTPQHTILEPTSMYGVSKASGELLCSYYHKKYKVDVRGIRYPGIISAETLPGGGTTDYAVAIYYDAIKYKKYKCYLKENTWLPMMYMPDALKAAIELMDSTSAKPGICYNLTAFSFTPEGLAKVIKKLVPEFEISFEIDNIRQSIADSWPDSIDDSEAQKDWKWKPDYSVEKMTQDMLDILSKKSNL